MDQNHDPTEQTADILREEIRREIQARGAQPIAWMQQPPDKPRPAAPTRATTFPHTAKGRKEHPVASGVLDYFPDALVAVARVSFKGNEQHNPGEPLHWARGKSTDEADALIRHFLQRGSLDDDGELHSAKMAWRALALLQKEIEQMQGSGR